MTTSTTRQPFRQLVAEIAAKAQAKLPECNGRIESAVKLVLNGDVELLPDGTAQVYSQSNGVTSYAVVNGHCDCADSPRAPHGYCKHRLSVGILRRVQQLLPQPPVPVEPETVPEPFPDNDPEPPVPPVEPAPTPAPACPEACFSATVKGTLDGHETLLTARGQTAAEFKRNLQAMRGLLDASPAKAAPAPAPIAEPGADYCRTHALLMKWNEGKEGRKGWYSHRLDDGSWCKGR